MSIQQRIIQEFDCQFGSMPSAIVRAPGRVNLIGEHTDYNDGFVLPMAIDRAVWIALRPRDDGLVIIHSLDFNQTVKFALNHFEKGSGWAEYIKGVAWILQQRDHSLRGFEGIVAGNVPIGAGLSSSAAWELAAARAFSVVSSLPWEAKEMALLAQQAENQWVGVNCGIMDQMISAAGKAGHALLIDCRSLHTEAVPLPPHTVVVVLDTATRRGLVDSLYNERRSQCEAAASFFEVASLRDVSIQQFEAQAGELEENTRRKAKHVITEIDRTLRAVKAMKRGDAAELGELIRLSHQSLRDDFEVSSHELNTMVGCAEGQSVCYGARMTGAGFGGCAVALVQADAVNQFTMLVAAEYQAKTGLTPQVYVCEAMNGAELVENYK